MNTMQKILKNSKKYLFLLIIAFSKGVMAQGSGIGGLYNADDLGKIYDNITSMKKPPPSQGGGSYKTLTDAYKGGDYFNVSLRKDGQWVVVDKNQSPKLSPPSSNRSSSNYYTPPPSPTPQYCYGGKCYWTEQERNEAIEAERIAKEKAEAERIRREAEEKAAREKEAKIQTGTNAMLNVGAAQYVSGNPVNTLHQIRPIVNTAATSNTIDVNSRNVAVQTHPTENVIGNNYERNIAIQQNVNQNDVLIENTIQFGKGVTLGAWDMVKGTYDLGFYAGTYYQTDFLSDVKYLWNNREDAFTFSIFKDFSTNAASSVYNSVTTGLGNTMFNLFHGDWESKGRATFDVGMLVYGGAEGTKMTRPFLKLDTKYLWLDKKVLEWQFKQALPKTQPLPNGTKVYHITKPEYVESIIKNGIFKSKDGYVYTSATNPMEFPLQYKIDNALFHQKGSYAVLEIDAGGLPASSRKVTGLNIRNKHQYNPNTGKFELVPGAIGAGGGTEVMLEGAVSPSKITLITP